MQKFSVRALAKIIKADIAQSASLEQQAANNSFAGVSIDSRTTKAGDCFFAIRGENFDGHDYVADAFAKGAVCAVVSKDASSCAMRSVYSEQKSTRSTVRNTRYAILIVDDTVKALGDFAREYRRQCGFKVVAITGSVGKTTTRHIVYHVLSKYYRVFQSPKNFNNNVGLPLTLLGADPSDEIIVAELGTNHPGEIAYLSGIARPDTAVVTNVYLAHLQGFGDLQAIIKEKLSISEALLANGVLIINDNIIEQLPNYQSPITNYQLPITRVVTFGEQEDSDWRFHDVVHNGFSSTFTIEGPRHSSLVQIHLPLPGQGNVENAVAAWAICSQFGLTIDDFAQAVRTISPISMRAELLQIGTLTVLNDSYNANPASMKNALDMFVSLRKTCDPDSNRRLVFICGDMAELGERAPELHAELGISIANAGIQLLLTVGKLTKITAEAAERTAQYELQALCFEDVFSVCSRLQEFIEDSDILLVKGSRTVELELVIAKLRDIYSPKEIRYPIRQLRTSKASQRAPSTEQQEAK